jgi:hypothetical protein
LREAATAERRYEKERQGGIYMHVAAFSARTNFFSLPSLPSTAGNQFNSWGFPQVPYSGPGLCRPVAINKTKKESRKKTMLWTRMTRYDRIIVTVLISPIIARKLFFVYLR